MGGTDLGALDNLTYPHFFFSSDLVHYVLHPREFLYFFLLFHILRSLGLAQELRFRFELEIRHEVLHRQARNHESEVTGDRYWGPLRPP